MAKKKKNRKRKEREEELDDDFETEEEEDEDEETEEEEDEEEEDEEVDTDEEVDDDLSEELNDLDEEWADTEAATFAEAPVGKHICDISSAIVAKSTNGRLQINWELVVSEGKFADEIIRKYDGLQPAQSLSFTKRGLMQLGIKKLPPKTKQLPSLLLALTGSKVEINVKKKDEYTNVYFNRMIEPSAALKKMFNIQGKTGKKSKKGSKL